jgi:hypothetical protein
MGFALQSFPPLAQPYAVSGALALLSLERPSNQPDTRRPVANAEASRRSAGSHKWDGLRNAPRLQGFAPRESPPHRADGLGRPEHVALLGFIPFRVLTLTEMALAFATPPLMRLPVRAASRPNQPTTGCYFQRDWLVSLETAAPPGL